MYTVYIKIYIQNYFQFICRTGKGRNTKSGKRASGSEFSNTESLTCSCKIHVGRKWCHNACPPECGHWCTWSHLAVSGNQGEGSNSWVTGPVGNWEPIGEAVWEWKTAKCLKVYLCAFDILHCVCWWAAGSSKEEVLKLQAECRQEGAGLQQTAPSYYWLVCSLTSAESVGLLIHTQNTIRVSLPSALKKKKKHFKLFIGNTEKHLCVLW